MKNFILLLIVVLLMPVFTFAQELVTVEPTWGEAFNYAHKTGQTFWTILGILCLIALVIILVLGFDKVPDWLASKFMLTCIILAVVGLCSIMIKPGNIRWNNTKTVDKAYLEKVGSHYIIDSCFKDNRLIGASIKK